MDIALLGSGAIATKVFRIAGGVAVLTAAMNFGVDASLSYDIDVALEKWEHKKFIEANKNMLTLPIPRNTSGGRGYKKAIAYLQKNYAPKKDINDKYNQQALRKSIDVL